LKTGRSVEKKRTASLSHLLENAVEKNPAPYPASGCRNRQHHQLYCFQHPERLLAAIPLTTVEHWKFRQSS
jgi:hypothetical protein